MVWRLGALALLYTACDGDPTTPTGGDETAQSGTTAVTAVESTTGDTAVETGTTDTGTTTVPDPSGLAWRLHKDFPTLVYVSWEQPEAGPATVEYSFDDDVWLSAPPLDAKAGPNEQLIVGVPYGAEVQYRVVGAKETKTAVKPIVIPDAPEDLPIPAETAAPGDEGEAPYLLTSVSTKSGGWSTQGPFYTVIYDRKGRPVWARTTPRNHWTLYAQVSTSGDHIIYDEFETFNADGDDAEAIRAHLDGEFERVPIAGHHHAFIELPDGTLAWGSKFHGGGESLVIRKPDATTDEVKWSCQEDWPEAGSCRSNSVYFHPADQTYVISFYTLEAIVVIDAATTDPTTGHYTTSWWAGKKVSGGLTFVDDKGEESVDDQFWWQHGVTFTDAGTLLVSTHDEDGTPTTNLGREYAVDLKARTLEKIWDYDAEVLAWTNGDIWRLDNGHTLHSLGSASKIKEVDEKGDVVWELDFHTQDHTSRMIGRSEFIHDLYPLLSTAADATEE